MNQNTITPEKQASASNAGRIFASMHEYLDSLKFKDADGNSLTSEQLRNAHARIEEAGTWAVKHILIFGVPPQPKPTEAEAPVADVGTDANGSPIYDPA